MPLRLFDPNLTHKIDVAGTVFHVKQLSGAELGIVQVLLSREVLTAEAVTKAEEIVASKIVSIEGVDGPYTDIVSKFADPVDFWMLMGQLKKLSTLSEVDRKNSGSSSAGVESSKQAGQITTTTAEGQENA